MKWSALILFAFTAVGCKDKGGDDTGSGGGDATAGAQVYADTCATCHGANGTEGEPTYPSLVVEIPDQTDAQLESIIQDGYGDMPAQGLTDTELADVIAYLRATFPG